MSRLLLPGLICTLALGCASCSSSKQAPPGPEAGARDAAVEGLSFRDTGPVDRGLEASPSPLDGGDANEDGTLVPVPDVFISESQPPELQVPKKDKGSSINCLADWKHWTCSGNALTGCTATCGKTSVVCNLLGQCTCTVALGGKQNCAPIPPIPPTLPGCGYCQKVFNAGCCGPTP